MLTSGAGAIVVSSNYFFLSFFGFFFSFGRASLLAIFLASTSSKSLFAINA
jgi:hypothetical protein